VPAILPQLLTKYFGLSEEAAARYRRACYWFCLARFCWDYSVSTSFFAYVVAIESLLPDLPPHTCPVCNAPHHTSITQAFKKFLEAHVPDTPERQKFYAMRSSIAHGSTLLGFDIREEFGGFYPGEMDQRSEIDALSQVCRVALVTGCCRRDDGPDRRAVDWPMPVTAVERSGSVSIKLGDSNQRREPGGAGSGPSFSRMCELSGAMAGLTM